MTIKNTAALFAVAMLTFTACSESATISIEVDTDSTETNKEFSINLVGQSVTTENAVSCLQGYETGDYTVELTSEGEILDDIYLGNQTVAPDSFQTVELEEGVLAMVQTYGTCNGDFFQFFAVENDGSEIENIAFEDGQESIYSDIEKFSFEDGVLKVSDYNNSTAEFTDYEFTLDFENKQFVLASETAEEPEVAENMFEFEDAVEGNKIGAFEVVSRNKLSDYPVTDYRFSLELSGEVEITGNYFYGDGGGFFEGMGCMVINQQSEIDKLPLYDWNPNPEFVRFCFENNETAIELLGKEDQDNITIVIDGYTANILEGEVTDMTTILEVK